MIGIQQYVYLLRLEKLMRKIIVLSFISLDGVMQAPGGPDEDTSSGFKYGGWTFYYFDEFAGKIMGEQMGHDYDLLLGRKTYDIFASYWPNIDPEKEPIAKAFNKTKKFVVSTTLSNPSWENSYLINKNVVEELKKLKESFGPELQVHGSGNLIQTLLKNDLVDELWLKIFPVTLGSGKRLFAEGTIAAGFELFDSRTSPSGVVFTNFRRSGEVRTGSFAGEETSKAKTEQSEKQK
jgi:dihydrofolate reductase